MKKFIFLAIAFFIAGKQPRAQEWENSTPDYKYASIWSSNGFYTLEEENRLMYESILAEKRRAATEKEQIARDNQERLNETVIGNRRTYANPEYKYPGYYTPTAWGANGFITVDDADWEMYKAVVAERRERARQDGRVYRENRSDYYYYNRL